MNASGHSPLRFVGILALLFGMLSPLLQLQAAMAAPGLPVGMPTTALPAAAGGGPDESIARVPDIVNTGKAVLIGRQPAATPVILDLSPGLRDQAGLESFIQNEADHGHYLTNAQFDANYGAPAGQVSAIESWANNHALHVSYTSPDGLTIIARGTTAAAESAFHVQINEYRDPSGYTFYSNNQDVTIPASLGVRVVDGLNSHLRFGTLLTSKPLNHAEQGSALSYGFGTGPQSTYIPSNYRSIYDLTGHVDGHGSQYDGTGQTIGLTLWGNGISDSDLATFATKTGTDPALTSCTSCSSPDTVQWIRTSQNNGSDDPNTEAEEALDVEYAHGMALHSHLKYFLGGCTIDASGACQPNDAGWEEVLSMAANDSSLHVVSDSWSTESEAAPSDPFVRATTDTFMHAVAVGTTFYFGSGDHGHYDGCGGNLSDPSCYLTAYPGDSPYVVSVGGTTLTAQNNGGVESYAGETGWNLDAAEEGGGGGCSNAFTRPSWQTGLASSASCDGRAIPDISADAAGADYGGAYVYVGGTAQAVGGTSLATPLVAGMAADTDRYLSENCCQASMGWAAPTLYQMGSNPSYYHTYFHDVTCGFNGYDAGPGWDQVTGWGSEDWYQYTLGFAGTPGYTTSAPTTQWGCQHTDWDQYFNPLVPKLPDLTAVSCATATTCVQVSGSGVPFATTDGGATWKWNGSQFVHAPIYSVACPSTTRCIATGDQGLIWVSNDGGNTWTQPNSTWDLMSFYGVACTDTNTCYTVAAANSQAPNDAGKILETTDGGTTWNPVASGTTHDLLAIACASGGPCTAVGRSGTIITNSGGSWSTVTSNTTSDLDGISCPSSGACYAVGASGTVLSNVSGSWSQLTSGTTSDLYGISCPSTGECFAVGVNTLISSSDSGQTWRAETTPLSGTGLYLHGIACPTVRSCIAVGQSGSIVRRLTRLTVTDTADNGCSDPAGTSLRCALTLANADGWGDTISFDIPSSGNACGGSPVVCTISPGTALPAITGFNTRIDGYTQPGTQQNTSPRSEGDNARIGIRIDGASLGYGFLLWVQGSGNTIRGLSITRNRNDSIEIYGSDNTVAGNFVGVTPAGAAAGNATGILIQSNGLGGSDNTIGGSTVDAANVVSGNASTGIGMYGSGATAMAGGNQVRGNFIGTDPTGTAALANGGHGVTVTSNTSGNVIGVDIINVVANGAGNVISGNTLDGVSVTGTGNTGPGNVVAGNDIGTNASGSAAVPNGQNGVEIGQGTSNAVIGSVSEAPSAINVISGNKGIGVAIDGGSSSTANLVSGNDIGVNSGATAVLGNGSAGVYLSNATNDTVIGNTVGGNASRGIGVNAGAGDDIVGNFLGTNVNGASLPNGDYGVWLYYGATNDSIVNNTIAYNPDGAVEVGASTGDSSHVSIVYNSMWSNGAGIGLSGLAPASCATSGTSGAPNDNLACPQIQTATTVAVAGTAPFCTTCDIQVFATASPQDGSGHGQGKTFLGDATASGGTWQLAAPFAAPLTAGQYVTATASTTSTPQETSEFSANVQVTGSPTEARVAGFSTRVRGQSIAFHWRIAIQKGVVGFDVFAGKHRLNPHLIRVHAGPSYRFQIKSHIMRPHRHGVFSLHVLLDNGREVVVPAR